MAVPGMRGYTQAIMEMTPPAPDCCVVPCFKEEVVARIKANLPEAPQLAQVATLFALLGDPMRLRIVLALADTDELCVCDVANVLGLSMSATSHHLRRLREAGLVTFRNDGKMAWYRLLDPFAAGVVAQARVWARPNTSTNARACEADGCCP